MRAESRLGLAIPDNFSEWRAERTATLNTKLKALAKAAADNAIPDAELSDKGLSISPIRGEESDRITTLSRRLYMLVPRIRITSLLAEVHSWTHFLDCFTHYRTGEQAEDEASLMAAILADATNAGAERMAQSSRGVTIHQMMVMVDRHLRAETYAAATSVLVDAQQEHPFAAIFGGMVMYHPRTGSSSLPADVAKPALNTMQNTASDQARRFMAFCRTGLRPFSPE